MDSECEIEFLDEDADIIQQCVQVPPLPSVQELSAQAVPVDQSNLTPLLVERTERPKRKKKKRHEEDSDYDPSGDYAPPSPPSPKAKRKKFTPNKKLAKLERSPTAASLSQMKRINKIIKENRLLSSEHQFSIRKKLNIRIPDYDDPLCLSVKAIMQEQNDLKRLHVWNNVCLEHFKHCDTMLRPERGKTKSSLRSVVLRNVVNKQSGKVETTIWSKTTVQNEGGDKKSEIFQCILPKYKEKKLMSPYTLSSKKSKPNHTVDEVILTKEVNKDGESLVVYKPKECVSSVYMLFDKGRTGNGDDMPDLDDDAKMFIKEMACCKVCAQCYQTSWRGGLRKPNKKALMCPVCGRSCVTLYNMLSHVRLHSAVEIARYRTDFAKALAQVVEYHYKCRICQKQFDCIKKLRKHVSTHQANEVFLCEVSNHMTQ